MSSEMTLSRPYAKAVFDLAKENDDISAWGERLSLLSELTQDENVMAVLAAPSLSHEQKSDVIIALVSKTEQNENVNSLIKLLAQNGRLKLFAAISEAFTQLKYFHENAVEAEVVTAVKVTKKYLESVKAALSKRLNKSVTISATVDKGILGGIIIRAGDLVVDGSLKGKLAKLTNTLIH